MTQFDKIARVLSSPPPPVASAADDEWLDVLALFRVVRRRIWLILLVGALIVAAFVPLILKMERTYSATARVLIHEPRVPALLASGLAPEPDLNLTTESERLVSRNLTLRVIAVLGLDSRPEFNPALREQTAVAQIKEFLRSLVIGEDDVPGGDAYEMDPVVRSYVERLGIMRAAGSEVVSIVFRSKDPELAALVPNTVIRVYLDESRQRATERMRRATAWLEGRIAEQERRLDKAVAAASAARKEAEEASTRAPGAMQALTDLTERRGVIVRRRAEIAARLSAFEAAGDFQSRAEAADTESVFMLLRQLDTEKTDLERMLGRYGPAQAGMIAAEARLTAEARIAGLERSIEAEVQRERRNLATEMAALEREEQAIRADLTATEQAVAQIGRVEARLQQLLRAAEVERTALDSLEQQLRDLPAEATVPTAEIEVLSPATVPLVGDGRGRIFYLAAAIFAAGLIALTAAFFVEMTDKTVRSHEQLRKIPGVVRAGFLPAVPRGALGDSRSRRLRRASRLYLDSLETVILALEQRGSGTLPHSIVVTSALPHEGKSTTALALALHLTQSGRRVVLVDADLRNGRLHQRFGVPAAPGLSDYLAGHATLDEVIRHDARTGVFFVPRGTGRMQRHIDRQLVKTLLGSANARHQMVIFDAAPALVTNEVLVLAGLSARTLLVVRWGRTTFNAVEAAVERLSQRSGQDIDVVINEVNLRRQALYGYRDAGDLARSLRRYHSRTA